MALEIFRLVGSVFVDTDKAEKSIHKTDKNAQRLGKSFLSSVKTAGKFGAAVVGAAMAAGAAIVSLTENTREYRAEQGRLKTAFEDSNLTSKDATKTYKALFGVLGDSGQAVEASSHLAALCKNEEQLNSWTNILTGSYGRWGSSLPVETLAESANMAVKNCEVSSGLADALNWAGVSSENFKKKLEKCSDENEREALIRETLNGLYSKSAENYRKNNAEIIAANNAQERLNSALGHLGGVLEPVATKGKEVVASLLERALPYIDWFAMKGVPAIGVFFSAVAEGFTYTFEYFGGLVDFFVVDIPAAVDSGIDAFSRGVDKIYAKWSGLKSWFGNLLNGVKQVFSNTASAIGNVFKKPINTIITGINSFISGLNKIQVPEWVDGVGGKGINIPTIPYLAQGGILERGQIGLLEGTGAEAVVPLHNNKRWISAVADDMAANGVAGDNSDELVQVFLAFLEALPQILLEALAGTKFEINGREFGRLVKAVC